MDNQAQKKNSANYGCFLMIVLQVIIACLLAETRAIATRCVRGDDVLQVVCLHGHGCTL